MMLRIIAAFVALASAAPVAREAAQSCYAFLEAELCGPTCPTCEDYVCECCSTFVIPPPVGPQPSYVCKNGHPPSDNTAEGEEVSCFFQKGKNTRRKQHNTHNTRDT